MSHLEGSRLVNPAINETVAAPRPTLSLVDAIAIIVGIVIGAGIFETPALVAGNVDSSRTAIIAWLLGGGISLVGALCYAELATTYPHPGGNYYYLKRAFGEFTAFLFAWARMAVIQTGSIALLAFVFGDYASQILNLGPASTSLYAATAIILFTTLNVIGLQQSKWTQNWLTAAKIVGLLLVIGMGLFLAGAGPAVAAAPTKHSFGLAMVFVLLSYGGWNEAAYISAEIRHGERNIVRSLLWSIGIITATYLLINLAYLKGLGLAGMASSQAVAADLMRQVLGAPGAWLISLLVAVSALGAVNATIFTGARTNYAFGQDVPLFQFMGNWRSHSNAPMAALLLQGAIALALVFLGTLTRKGFSTMVDYTAPVFWFFFLLSGLALFIFRLREPNRSRPFAVPLYPLVPLLFCTACGYLLYSSLDYTKIGALLGVAVVVAGIPVLLASRKQPPK